MRINKKALFTVLTSALLFPFITCIERNNPWDPINGCPEEVRADYRIKLGTQIEPYRSDILKSAAQIDSSLNHLEITRNIIDSIMMKNDSIKRDIEKFKKVNDSLESFNNNAECKLLRLKDSLPYLDTISIYVHDKKNVLSLKDSFSVDSLRIVSLIASGFDSCPTVGIYNPAQVDSITQPFNAFEEKVNLFVNTFRTDSLLFCDTNRVIRDYNNTIRQSNLEIAEYNDSIFSRQYYCEKNPVTDVDSLRKHFNTLQPGDTLYIASGNFSGLDIKLTNLGNDTSKEIVVMGSPYGTTTISSSSAVLSNTRNVKFENITFQNSIRGSSGIKTENGTKEVTFNNCIFKNNSNFGVYALHGSVTLINCIIDSNTMGGIYVEPGSYVDNTLSLTMRNVLITHNFGNGLTVLSTEVNAESVTISDNLGDGVYLSDFNKTAIFKYTIFSYNGNNGLERKLGVSGEGNGDFFTPNCDFFGNGSNAIIADQIYLDYNKSVSFFINVEPMFADHNNGNYRLLESSPAKGMGYQYK